MYPLQSESKHLIPLDELYLARLEKTRNAMVSHDVPVMLLVDPVNIFYVTGASNMSVFAMRTASRYLLLFAEGPCILFDYLGCEHLSQNLPTVDQVRTAAGLCFVSSNQNASSNAKTVAQNIREIVLAELGEIGKCAIGRFPFPVIDALRGKGFELSNSDIIMHTARSTKLPAEIPYLKEAMRRAELAVLSFESAIEPGKTEAELWSNFHQGLIGGGGKYVTTRLMQSGENTFPYFQECGEKTLSCGDLVCLDTDAVGYEGYAVDFSRTFLCGDTKASGDQKMLYQRAKEQLEHNVELFVPGRSFEEIASKAWIIPDEHQDSRYYCIGHGLGMSGEFPNIPHARSGHPYPLSGKIESNMVICVESYIGSVSSRQGVKLEQQLLITAGGAEVLSQYHFDDRLS
ncbi:MAG: Xaa-Pro peptidase family protein [Acidiferrobacterales bacterium]|nr:Xaa-Pro peptidase family protein [Acidiferrobacterales bacterium]